ncbi:MAG: CotH kinase family protein [Saprospiraceae bacterium]|nr:CotH kinase family protein [Saprospiraceae bacterium]
MKRIIQLAFCAYICSFGVVIGQNQSDFYDIKAIQEVAIRFEQANWRDILDSLRFNGDNLLSATVTINGKKFENAQVRYRNARAFQIGGKHNSLFIQLPEGQHYQGYASVELSNALRDPSMVREVLAYEIARQYMPAPKANYAKVMVNNSYYGFFVNVESVGDTFLKDHFGNSDGELYHAEAEARKALPDGCNAKAFSSLQYDGNEACYTYNFNRISTKDWGSLIELTRVLNEEPENISRLLNVDRTLWMLAFNNVLVNLNSYTGHPSHNYYLYKDIDGRFSLILGDLNFVFGSFKNTDGGSDLRFAGFDRNGSFASCQQCRTPAHQQFAQG